MWLSSGQISEMFGMMGNWKLIGNIMNKDYWHNRWEENNLGFNQSQPNPGMVRYFERLDLEPGGRVFVPLCGKSIDMLWLLQQGYQVIACELDPIACEAFFQENQLEYTTKQLENFTVFSGNNITLFQGDFFQLNKKLLGAIDAIYDRAALVALPESMRIDYSKNIIELSETNTQMLLITMGYDQHTMAGPPFSVIPEEVKKLYQKNFEIEILSDKKLDEVPEHFQPKGLEAAWEYIFKIDNTLPPL